ncbi:MAG: hypothetical protein AAGA58_11320 [Verrucomicrobiota bacterium]
MKRYHKVLLAFAGGMFACGSVQAEKLSLLEFIPESAPVILHVTDIEEVSEQWADSPFGKALADEKLEKFLAPMMEKMKSEFSEIQDKEIIEEALGKIRNEFSGEMVAAVIDMPISQWVAYANETEVHDESPEAWSKSLPHMVVMGEVGEGFGGAMADLTKTLAQVATEEDNDVSAFFEKEKDGEAEIFRLELEEKGKSPFNLYVYGEANGVGVLGWPKSAVTETLRAVREQDLGEPSATGGAFADFRARYPESSAIVHMDLEAGFAEMFKALEDAAEAGDLDLSEMENMGMSMESLRKAIGIDDWRSLAFGMEFFDDRMLLNFGMLLHKRSGFMKVMAYENGLRDFPEFVPPQAPSVTVSRFNVQELWTELKIMINTLSPQFSEQFFAGIGQFEQMLEMSLEDDLIKYFGKTIVQVEDIILPDLAEDGVEADLKEDNVVAFELKNAQSFELGLDKLVSGVQKRMGLPVATEEYLGTEMYFFGNPPQKVSFFVKGDYFFLSVGVGNMVKKVISTMNREGGSLWEEQKFKDLIAEVSPDYCGVGYVKFGNLARGIADMFLSIEGLMEGEDMPVDFSAMPDGEWFERIFGEMLGAQYMEDDGFFGEIILMPGK